MENRNSARMGKAVEFLVAASAILVSDFELSVSTSMVDDDGVDLVFHRRDQVETLAVQVKARSTETSTNRESGGFIANVSANTFKPRRDLFMLFVLVDTSVALFEPIWLVPSVDFNERTSPNGQGRHRFAASSKTGSKDQWSSYRFGRADLAARLLDALDGLRTPDSA